MERGLIDGVRAHDLLRVTRLVHADDEPDWVRDTFALTPWVVVRRAVATRGLVAVGMRGKVRAQRFATWVNIKDIESIREPETLRQSAPSHDRLALPAFAALAALRATSSPLDDYVWGPTGSAGFELATGVHTVSGSSDLDLLIRMPEPPGAATLRALADTLAQAAVRAGTRVDAQLETPAGGVALSELAAGVPRVLARADDGPRLIENPWCRS